MATVLDTVLQDDVSEEELEFFKLGEEEKKEPVKRKKEPVSEPTEEELEFFALESPYQQEPVQEDVGYWKSILNSVPNGLIEGIVRFGRMMGPLQDEPGSINKNGEYVEGEKYDPEKIAEQLDKWFPVDEDADIPQVIKGAGKVLPTAMGTPPIGKAMSITENVVRSVAGSAAGKVAEKSGLPEWAQTIAEIAPWLAPNLAAVNQESTSIGGALSSLEKNSPGWAKKLVSKHGPDSLKKTFNEMIEGAATRKEILNFAKAAGMKEAEITPLLQGESKQRWLSKLASKGEKMEGKLVDTKNAIGKVYDSIRELPGANTTYDTGQRARLIKSLQDKFEKMPVSVKNVIQEDFQKLIDGPINGDKVMDFYLSVNHELGPKTKQLSLLKDPIKKSLMEVDRSMGQMFDMTNKLYGKFSGIAKRLKPGLAEGLWSEGKSQGALWGVVSGDYGILTKIAKVSGAKKVAEFMLTSPRWHNLSGKMVNALNSGKFVVAEHIKKQMIDQIKDVDPRVAAALEELKIRETLED